MSAFILRRILLLTLVAMTVTATVVPIAVAREVVDSLGRRVSLPDSVTRVYATAPPTSMLVYAMAPETLVSFNANLTPAQKTGAGKFLDARVASLPDFGSMMGHGKQADIEQIMTARPDVAVAWANPFIDNAQVEERFAKAGIPLVFVNLDQLSDYPAAFALMGRIFGRETRAAQLASYVEDALSRVRAAIDSIPLDRRMSVYYAESPDGLTTDCDSSFHAEPIRLAGGANVYRCAQHEMVGMEQVSLEQVVRFAPRIIIAQDASFTHAVIGDPRWRNVQAVADRNVHSVPRLPFNWLDRPPSYTRALGIQWLANLFYPDVYRIDIRQETKDFYRLFFNVDVTDADVDLIVQ